MTKRKPPKARKTHSVQVTLEFTDAEIEEFLRFMFFKKACGNFNPDCDPADAVLATILKVLMAARTD